jgi:two-component system response regulator BaeR
MTSPPAHILIVEDEPRLQALVRDYAVAQGWRASCLDRGDTVVAQVQADPPDLIVLDLMLPGLDGLQVCQAVRAFSDVPILMLTARVEEVDRLIGLEAGADDYVCKPFSPREVVARIKAILRRPRAQPAPVQASPVQLLTMGPFELDDARLGARYHGTALDLTPAEWRLLRALVGQPGRVFSRDRLLDLLHDDTRASSDRAVDSHIKNLRRKLQAVRPDDEPIRSIYGVGYKCEP